MRPSSYHLPMGEQNKCFKSPPTKRLDSMPWEFSQLSSPKQNKFNQLIIFSTKIFHSQSTHHHHRSTTFLVGDFKPIWNILVKLNHFPTDLDWEQKNIWNHHLAFCCSDNQRAKNTEFAVPAPRKVEVRSLPLELLAPGTRKKSHTAPAGEFWGVEVVGFPEHPHRNWGLVWPRPQKHTDQTLRTFRRYDWYVDRVLY